VGGMGNSGGQPQRLSPPPPAAEPKPKAATVAKKTPMGSTLTPPANPGTVRGAQKGGKKKGKKGEQVASPPPPISTAPPKKELSRTQPDRQAKTAPPPTNPTSVRTETPAAWSKVVGRKERKREAQRIAPPSAVKSPKEGGVAIRKGPQQQPRQQQQQQQQQQKRTKTVAKRKVPRTEAVVINCPSGTYAEVMSRARREIDPKALDIDT